MAVGAPAMAYRQQGGYGRGGGGGGRGGGARHYQQAQEMRDPVLDDTLRIRDLVMRCMGEEDKLRLCMQLLTSEFDQGKWNLVRASRHSPLHARSSLQAGAQRRQPSLRAAGGRRSASAPRVLPPLTVSLSRWWTSCSSASASCP